VAIGAAAAAAAATVGQDHRHIVSFSTAANNASGNNFLRLAGRYSFVSNKTNQQAVGI
jgi:hypothetical protein